MEPPGAFSFVVAPPQGLLYGFGGSFIPNERGKCCPMDPLPQSNRARHWEQFGIVAGFLLILMNWGAAATGWLAGPLFHPVLILLGAILVYACAALLAGAASDSADTS